VVRAPDRRVVATTDLLVEGRHFRRDWSGPFDIGCKAAAQNLADVAAMGASPTALLVGFATPGDLAVAWAEDLARGIAEECGRAGAHVAGGDVSSADSIMIAITALGDLGGREPVTRGGAHPGDRLAVAEPDGAAEKRVHSAYRGVQFRKKKGPVLADGDFAIAPAADKLVHQIGDGHALIVRKFVTAREAHDAGTALRPHSLSMQ